MEMKFRKFLPLVGALCLGLTSTAFAHSNYQNGNGSSSYGSSSSMDSSSSQGTYQRGTFREITPNAGPRVAHGADVFITADFLWWNASEDGLNYSAGGLHVGSIPLENVYDDARKGKVAAVGSDWSPGFKIGLGLNLAHDGWDLYTEYTWLHSSDNSSYNTHTKCLDNNNDELISSFSGFGGLVPADTAIDVPNLIRGVKSNAKWKHRLNVINLELGRNFYLSQFLTMRPHIGLKGTWQDTDYSFNFTASENALFKIHIQNADALETVGPYRMHGKTGTWGIGVRGGLDLSYFIAKSWSLYGNLAWTSMWSNYYELKRQDTLYIPNDNDNNDCTHQSKLIVNIANDSLYTIKYVGEMELGLRWETWFCDDNYHFAVQAGWEQQVWLNWGVFTVLEEPQIFNDLTFHGLNLKFRFDF